MPRYLTIQGVDVHPEKKSSNKQDPQTWKMVTKNLVQQKPTNLTKSQSLIIKRKNIQTRKEQKYNIKNN
jgi:hypothetical protein